MPDLQNRVALVTGAGRGIGRASAVALAREGATVALAARTEAELDETFAEVKSIGGRAAKFLADLTDRNVSRTLVERVKQQLGPVEILLNNAGIGSSANPKPLATVEEEFWDLTIELNLNAPYILTKSALPDMLKAGWGRIITIASINSRVGSVHAAAYSASKHGVLGMMRALALEVATTGVTANCICPGPVKTRMNDARIQHDAQRLGRDLADIEHTITPIGGRLVPEDIAPMVVYLAGPAGKMITGQAYNICGGLVMS